MDEIIRRFLSAHRNPRERVVVVTAVADHQLRSGARGPTYGTSVIEDGVDLLRVTGVGEGEGAGPPIGWARSNDRDGGASGIASRVDLRWSDPPAAWIDGQPALLLRCTAEQYRDRVRALPGADTLVHARAVLVGLGSVGSLIGRLLVDLGVNVTAFDPDVLSGENLVRWALPVVPDEQVGRPKARVFEEHLRRTSPGCQVTAHTLDVVTQARDFERIVEGAEPQVIVAATDTRDSRRQVNATALRLMVPAVFVSLSDEAASVRVEVVTPGGACHLCSLGAEDEGDGSVRRSRRPYMTDERAVVAVPALPVDAAMGSLVAARVILEILAGRDWTPWFRCGEQVGNVLFMSLRPDFWVFTDAWQRLVVQTVRRPTCLACGGGT